MDLSPGQLAERLVGSEGGKTAADMSKNYAVSPFCPFWGPLELLWDCTAGQHITGLTLGAARLWALLQLRRSGAAVGGATSPLLRRLERRRLAGHLPVPPRVLEAPARRPGVLLQEYVAHC